nr:hypothetical protein [Actinomadura madurae]
MAVEVVAGSVATHGGAWGGVACSDLHIAQIDFGIQHGGHEGVAEHARVHARQPDNRFGGESAQAPDGGVPIHPDPAGVEQDRSGRPVAGGVVDGSADCRWRRGQHDPGALADHAEDSLAVFLVQVVDVDAGGLEDPQPD